MASGGLFRLAGAALVGGALLFAAFAGAGTAARAGAAACAGAPRAPEIKPLAFGSARDYGAAPARALGSHAAITAMAADSAGGYWLVASSGRVFAFGAARSYGSARGQIVAIAASAAGRGYWLASSSGRVRAFGAAPSYGDALNQGPVVALTATPGGRGYWLLTSTGMVLARGNARSAGQPRPGTVGADFVAMAATPDGRGYWLASASGGVLSYGDARFYGSAIQQGSAERIVSIAATGDGTGYWLATSNGDVLAYGDARRYPAASPASPTAPIVSMAAAPDGRGYWLAPGVMQRTTAPAGPGFVACRVTVIGDSVMLDVAPALKSVIPGIDVQAALSRQWDQGVALAQQLRTGRTLGATVVVELGTNGPITAAQFAAMMDALRGASRVVFVTVHLPASYSWSQSVNQVLEAGAAHYRQDRVADFATVAAAHPEWFGSDGIHMPTGGPGAVAMAMAIKQAVDE